MNVLMIAYEFPPAAAGGVMRTVKHCKYLPQFGWRPHVLTPRASTVTNSDPSLLREIKGTTTVHRCRSWEYEPWLNRLCSVNWWSRLTKGVQWRLRRVLETLAYPDPMKYWAVPALGAGLRICRQHPIHAVYSTSWPYSDHWTGLWLHRLTGLPWVADFRDPWLQHHNYGRPTVRRDRWNRRFEALVCRSASAVISATASATRALRESHPDIPPGKFITIRNGYDPADFVAVPMTPHHFSIVHVGSFYGSRNPVGFCEGVRRFLNRMPDARQDLRISFAGAGAMSDSILPKGVAWRLLPWVSHEHAIELMQQAAILLLIQHREPAVGLTVPGKLYEYIASGKHVLCLNTQPGENAGLLRAYRNSTLLWDDHPDHVATALSVLYRRYRSDTLQVEPRMQFVERFTRVASTEKLAKVLNRAVEASARRTDPGQPAHHGSRFPSAHPTQEELICAS